MTIEDKIHPHLARRVRASIFLPLLTMTERLSHAVPLAMPSDEVHVWLVDLSRTAGRLERYAGVLSSDERQRAARYAFDLPRLRFIATRKALRELLGGYLNIPPHRIRLGYGEHGKPYLAGSLAVSGLHFNLAHSGDLALLAFARGRRVGVDVEQIRPLPELMTIANRYFTANEAAQISALPEEERRAAFFACWTRKEAFIKALGAGFALPPDRFEVSLGAGEPPRLVAVKGMPGEAGRWTLAAWEPRPGYSAALAVEGSGWTLVQKGEFKSFSS